MCKARFESSKSQPVIEASIVFPSLEIGHEVQFVVDTGADATCVTKLDSMDGAFHPSKLPEGITVLGAETEGVGGVSNDYFINEPALLSFEEFNENRERFSLHIEYLPGIRVSEGSPMNLLGRDILHRFRMEYDPIKQVIDLQRDNYGGGRYECISSSEELSSSLRDFGDREPD